jgi:hypothetical protein
VIAPLRIAFDMDGTLANLSSAYADMEQRLFGAADEVAKHPAPEVREQEQQVGTEGVEPDAAVPDDPPAAVPRTVRNRDRVWRAIEATPDFWTTLQPLEDGAVKRLFDLTGELNWEVFFITQRPATAGHTVQWQTHRWLVEQGFATPSVLPLSGGRGRAAAALRLDYLVDDTPQNCVDVVADSSTRAILLITPGNALSDTSTRRLGIGVARSLHEALDLLVQATSARGNPTLFDKLKKIVGWR